MRSVERVRLAPARPQDWHAMSALVTQAYSPYVERIGRPPAPMLADWRSIARSGTATLAWGHVPAAADRNYSRRSWRIQVRVSPGSITSSSSKVVAAVNALPLSYAAWSSESKSCWRSLGAAASSSLR